VLKRGDEPLTGAQVVAAMTHSMTHTSSKSLEAELLALRVDIDHWHQQVALTIERCLHLVRSETSTPCSMPQHKR
jgi:hypothetical protein